ncbi:MAG: phosphate ABC transporter permease subunit PstC [Candidatus Omnitrophica bacterium]|nr:phosphate ABC transporter permease subunit PstC [Candidatus Omnitrophota bacterium]
MMTIVKKRLFIDRCGERGMWLLVMASSLIVVFMVVALYLRSRPILDMTPLNQLLFGQSWHPSRGEFGFLTFLVGTLWVTLVAVTIAIPVCIFTSIYLVEYAPRWVRDAVNPLIDILAGIPSVVFGMWGVLVIVPLVSTYLAPMFGTWSSGYSILSGGIVLAVMISPVIIHIVIEVLNTIPRPLKEASLALGATKWETIKHVVLKRAMPGMIAASVLGLSRAFGETIAVMMVVGNMARLPASIFDPAYPLPALIANNYGEMMSIPHYDAALLFAALLLLCIVLYFNIVSRMILGATKWSSYYHG